jgi:hypothetical protein
MMPWRNFGTALKRQLTPSRVLKDGGLDATKRRNGGYLATKHACVADD